MQHFFEEFLADYKIEEVCERLLDMDDNENNDRLDYGVDARKITELKNESIQTNFPGYSHEHIMKPNR